VTWEIFLQKVSFTGGEAIMLCTSQKVRPDSVYLAALNWGGRQQRPALSVTASTSGNWGQENWLSDTSMDCQQGRDF
jgi:hypothetical protein